MIKEYQSRDPLVLVHALFKSGVLGQDMAVRLLDVINGIKLNLFILDVLELVDITSIYKNKGSGQDLKITERSLSCQWSEK